jgi:hypothetical protein
VGKSRHALFARRNYVCDPTFDWNKIHPAPAFPSRHEAELEHCSRRSAKLEQFGRAPRFPEQKSRAPSGAEKRLIGMTGRWTFYCSFFILISTSFPPSTFAQNQIEDEARSVTAGCHEALKRTRELQTFDAGICLGILKGLHYLSKDICIPPATSLGQIGDVVSQYFDNHTSSIHDDFQENALDAMRSAWPCGGRNNI